MTVIRPNSIAGINSITAQSNTIGFFKSDGTTLGVTLTGISFGDVSTLSVTGVSTLSGGVNASQGADLARLRVTGISTLGQTNITGLSNAGLSTLGNVTSSTLVVSGVSTLSGGVNASQGVDLARLRVTGITTLGQAPITGLSNAGVSTLGNATASTLVVSGVSTLGNATASTLVVSGVSTVGVVTGATSIQATNFYGSGANLTGVAATSNISTNALVNSGVTTTSGLVVSGVTTTGLVVPAADNTHNLGSSSFRWANIFSADLQLSNEGSINDIDGTWGKYTIQEGENNLFLINRRTGKQYKFVLEEVN